MKRRPKERETRHGWNAEAVETRFGGTSATLGEILAAKGAKLVSKATESLKAATRATNAARRAIPDEVA